MEWVKNSRGKVGSLDLEALQSTNFIKVALYYHFSVFHLKFAYLFFKTHSQPFPINLFQVIFHQGSG